MGAKMAEFLVNGSLAVYLVALVYGAYRIHGSGESGRSVVSEYCRRFISRRSQPASGAQDLTYYV